MTTRVPYFLFITICICIALGCIGHSIKLGIVRNIPFYFQNNLLIGEDSKAMEEKNAFILATGKIDTTDETPSQEVAFISINKQTIQLNFTGRIKAGDKTNVTYAGQGYTLLLQYDDPPKDDDGKQVLYGHASIKIADEKQESEYKVLVKRGYY